MNKSVYLLLFLASFSTLKAQLEGIIHGRVKNGSGIAVENADVFLEGTEYFVFTDVNGYYELQVKPGAYKIVFTGIGYGESIYEINVKAGERLEVSTQLEMSIFSTNQLGEAVVVGKLNKETESALLMDRKKSVFITENIGAVELNRKGVNDVSTAVTKVSGISKQEGSSVVYVRGLGDRYNSTTMNGLPIPSNDPEYKNIDLGILSTDIVGFIGVDKVYNNSFFGDFAGGNVNIVSKTQNKKGFFSIGMSVRGNSNALKNQNFKLQSGINWFGFDKSQNPGTLSEFIFENGLNPKKYGALGTGFSVAAGDRFDTGNNGSLGYFISAAHDNEYTGIKDGFLKSGINAQGEVQGKDFQNYIANSYNTNSTAFLNLNYRINKKNNLSFNSLFVNSSNQKLEEGEGYIRDNANEGGFLRRGTYVQNILWVNQLLGDHKISERTDLKWAIGYNTVKSDMPDRFQNIVEWKGTLNQYVLANSSASLNHRYFQDLNENEAVGNIALGFKFSQDQNAAYRGKLSLGYNGRFKNRDFEAIQYNLVPKTGQMYVNFDDLDAFFNSSNFNAGNFSMSTFSGQGLSPQFYTGKQFIHGAFANIEYRLSPKLIAVLGLRGEYIFQKVEWNTSLDPAGNDNELDEFQFLPSINLKYELTEKQNLRFGISKTYTLPQFKERALFMYEDLGETVYGWPTTYASTDYNADLKWELFPNNGEILSVAAFGKYIENPINKLTVASSTNDVSYANTGDWGYVIGAELEFRKTIYKSETAQPLQLSVGTNLSYIHTNQQLNSEKVFSETLLENGSRLNANFTKKETSFQGASDLLLNADISFSKQWEKDGDMVLTLVYNYISDRIYAIGTDERGNIVEKGIGTLDFIIRSKINRNIGINFNAKNLLNPVFERVQENAAENLTVLHYRKGINMSLGVNYQF